MAGQKDAVRGINRVGIARKCKDYLAHPLSLLLFLLVTLAAVITVFVLFYIIVYILAKGVPYLTPSLLSSPTPRRTFRSFLRSSQRCR